MWREDDVPRISSSNRKGNDSVGPPILISKERRPIYRSSGPSSHFKAHFLQSLPRFSPVFFFNLQTPSYKNIFYLSEITNLASVQLLNVIHGLGRPGKVSINYVKSIAATSNLIKKTTQWHVRHPPTLYFPSIGWNKNWTVGGKCPLPENTPKEKMARLIGKF